MSKLKCSECGEDLNCVCATFVTRVNEEDNDNFCWRCWMRKEEENIKEDWELIAKLRNQVEILKEVIKEMVN